MDKAFSGQSLMDKSTLPFLNEIYMRARIMGGHAVMVAIDRIACPQLTPEGAVRLKDAMTVLQKFSMHLIPEEREALQSMIANHLKLAFEQKRHADAVKAGQLSTPPAPVKTTPPAVNELHQPEPDQGEDAQDLPPTEGERDTGVAGLKPVSQDGYEELDQPAPIAIEPGDQEQLAEEEAS